MSCHLSCFSCSDEYTYDLWTKRMVNRKKVDLRVIQSSIHLPDMNSYCSGAWKRTKQTCVLILRRRRLCWYCFRGWGNIEFASKKHNWCQLKKFFKTNTISTSSKRQQKRKLLGLLHAVDHDTIIGSKNKLKFTEITKQKEILKMSRQLLKAVVLLALLYRIALLYQQCPKTGLNKSNRLTRLLT